MSIEHSREKLACGRRWEGPGRDGGAPLWHLCRSHVIETGECVCPCGARSLAPNASEAA